MLGFIGQQQKWKDDLRYGIYHKNNSAKAVHEYDLLAEYATMKDDLASTCIEGRPFAEVIMDDDTELLGQD